MDTSTPIVLTNGAWYGAWCWGEVVAELASRGRSAVPVELEGFGGLSGFSPAARYAQPFDAAAFATEPSGVAGVTLGSATARLVEDLRRVGGGAPVTVVAHSLGAVVVTAAAEQAPELFSRVAYVSSMTPVAGLPPSAYNALPEMAASLLPRNFAADPGVVGALRCDFDSAAGRELARETFYHDVSPATADRAASMLASDAPIAVDHPVPVTKERFGSVPRSWVLCEDDKVLLPAVQHRLIGELDEATGTSTTVHHLDSSRSPFLSQPQRLVDALLADG